MSRGTTRALQLALDAHRERRYADAEAGYLEILDEVPSNLEARMMLGILAAQTDREEMAVGHLIIVAQNDPRNFEALKWLSGVLSYLNRHAEAEPYARRAVEIMPTDYDALLKLATAYFGQAKYDEAARTFMQGITLHRTLVPAYYGMATTLLRLGEPIQARDVLRDAVTIDSSAETLLKLGEVALACEEPKEALSCARRVLRSNKNDVGALILTARAYRNNQNEGGEDTALENLRSFADDNDIAHTLVGRRYQSLGEFPEAEREFRRSIELRPEQGVAYYGITAGRRITEDDRILVDSMESISLAGNMNQDEQAHLHFALGKSYDNLGQYGEAMAHFDEGNRLMKGLRMGTRKYDRTEATNQVDRIISLFTKEFFEEQRHGSPLLDLNPIFIAGIMRSGTTLAEQILSCHPDVGGGGEQSFWRPAEFECVDYQNRRVVWSKLDEKIQEYVARLGGISPGKPYVTDKNPANRMVYGLLHLAFPDSRIVHMHRNPVDVAISIYTTLIRTGAQFVGDREDIVFALKEHDRLVNHWKSVIPEDRLTEVKYESLIGDREAETQRIVEFCGLPWNEACLHPENNLRTVVTPSFWQVRQPVYSASVDRWRKYEPWLGAFAELIPS